MKRAPMVAIVGKPNSGKSTLFNRIIKRRKAIAHATRGATRDTIEERVLWSGVEFILMDTGGFGMGAPEHLDKEVRERVRRAADEAAVVIFVADVDTGPTEEDDALLRDLRSARGKMICAVNKVENDADRWSVHDFHRLGFKDLHAVSALHGTGIGELLDDVVARLPRRKAAPRVEPLVIAIVGKPNVGKSSLANALAGSERNIVAEKPGTTRDSIGILIRRAGREFIIVDTAGVKRRSRTDRGLAAIVSLKSLASARGADIVLCMLDASQAISRQDVRVASEGHRARKGMIILVNKWDLVEKDSKTAQRFDATVREAMPFLFYAPILTVSALTRLRVDKILPLVVRVEQEREKAISTSDLNRCIQRIIDLNPPSHYAGGTGKVYYATQTGTKPPTFTFFVNKASYFPRSYIRYINNGMRKIFTFDGTAITISLKSKER
jgi:GTP-binding protein